MASRLNTASTAPSTFAPERNECLNSRRNELELGRLSAARSKCRRICANSRGAAPWNEKIDCFSSPTAKIVRVTVARAGAGGEFGDQPLDDLPLLRAGVLRLVDQHMVDAEVELVVHPGGIDVCSSSASVLSIRSS